MSIKVELTKQPNNTRTTKSHSGNGAAFYYARKELMNVKRVKIEAGKITGVKAAQQPTLEEQIRQIVREELAAHEERQRKLTKEFLSATEVLLHGTSG